MLAEIPNTDKLLDAIDTLLLVLDAEGRVISINQVGCELTGYTAEEAAGQAFWSLCFPKEESALVQQLFKEIAQPPHRLTHEHLWRGKTGQERRVSFTIAALHNRTPEPSGYVVTGLDITDLRRTEHELWEYRENLEQQVQRRNTELVASEARLSGILDTAEDAVISIDDQQKIVLFNHGAEKIFGYTSEEILGKPLGKLLPQRSRKSHKAHVNTFGASQEISRRMSERTEIFGLRKDGTEFDAEASISKLDLKGQRLYTAFLRDISERKRMERELRDSLHEKEVLLREIHHRVKNNLQVISSLFTLQSRTTTDPELLTLLKESQHRIQSMALIHEKLYQSENLSRIAFDHYVRDLVTDIFQSYSDRLGRIRLNLDLRPLTLEIATAIPTALVLNELVTNTFKHAFPDRQEGTLAIGLFPDESVAGRFVLRVEDDGGGIPEAVDPAQTKSLGLRLVRVLVSQLQGTLSLERGSGTRFTLYLPQAPTP